LSQLWFSLNCAINNTNFQRFQTTLYVGWTVCSLMFLAAIIGPSKMGSIDYVYDPIHAAAYNAFAPIGWCSLFLWIAITQHTGSSNGNYYRVNIAELTFFINSNYLRVICFALSNSQYFWTKYSLGEDSSLLRELVTPSI